MPEKLSPSERIVLVVVAMFFLYLIGTIAIQKQTIAEQAVTIQTYKDSLYSETVTHEAERTDWSNDETKYQDSIVALNKKLPQ